MLGLYVHIPFCNKICPYCDFYKLVASDNLKKKFVNALSQEMKIKNLDKYFFDSLYIGGGSPSCLKLDLLEELFSNLSHFIDLKNLKEYISCPVIAACGGSYMCTADLLENQKWGEIIDLCKKSVEIVKEARGL